MTDLKQLLQEADPARVDGELSPAAAQQMRRTVINAVPETPVASVLWRRPLAFAAAAVLLIAIGTLGGHRVFVGTVPDANLAVDPLPTTGGGDVDCRQLQFSTPGGTRIIWIFDQNLRLQESMP
jgi:hypothetical protein